jgi:dephospho-CoA kinase
MIVGITGNYCSGKSIASSIFQKHGYEVVDVDLIGHRALEDRRQEIVLAFGRDILEAEQIDRKRLGKIVFNDPERKRKLEEIVHPEMVRMVREAVKKRSDVVINAALLIEMRLNALCEFVIGLDVNDEVAIRRGMERDNLTREEAALRLQAQIPLKEKLHYVDKVIENNGGKQDFEKKILELIRLLGKRDRIWKRKRKKQKSTTR